VEAVLAPLLPLYQRERAAGRALSLGVLVHTDGSTYRKPGALILIAASGDYAGLISGGCLEGDLRTHAQAVVQSGAARLVRYDLRGDDDLLWGLGLGCEGAMQILLLRVGPDSDWQPLAYLAAALDRQQATALGVVVASQADGPPVGSFALPDYAVGPPALASAVVREALRQAASCGQSAWLQEPSHRLFVLPLSLPPRVLLLGAGPDAVPVVDFAARLNWKVTLLDHRPAYAVAAHFPSAEQVVLAPATELATVLELERFSAAVVMSHHLPTDLAYLRALARSPVRYVGLLGPAVRRERLLSELAGEASLLAGRLRAPVGLPLGGRTPESIALSIVAQIHAFLFNAL
jgi:xanthine/CO dehydrogenase XdhC/CoxF family maturation factor